MELPDVFACLSCDNALFLDETERKTGDFSCPHCGQKNSAAETRVAAAEQLATVEDVAPAPVAEHKFDELIECPDCEKAIKLMPEERDNGSVNCPYCKATISAPEPPVEEEPAEEVVPEKAEPAELPQEEPPQEETVQETAAETPKSDAEEVTAQPEPEATPEPEEAPLSVDETEEAPSAEPAEKTDGEEAGEVDLSTDEAPEGEATGEEEPEESGQGVNTGLLKNLIESSRNQSLLPERFTCPKCDTEIELPKVERQISLCFCPECEEMIDSETASENTSEQPEATEGEQVEEGEGAAEEAAEPSVPEGEGATEEDVAEQDPAAAQEEVAAEMEVWLVNVLAGTADCSKCGNSLKLEDEEKMFGIYRCPYCKADINHAKGAVVESLIPLVGEEDEEEEPAAKRKPVNVKALLPYAAVLVFGVALNYAVIAVTGYIQEKKALKAQWVLQLKADQVEMEQQSEVFARALTNAANKEAFAGLDEMSLGELKDFRDRLLTDKSAAYAIWFEDTGDEITVDLTLGPVVERFRWKLNRFMRRVQLAKIDADNLESAIGMSLFERQRARELIEEHIASIRNQMNGLSADEAIDQALVKPEVLADLMNLSLMVDQFEMQSVKQAVVHLNSMTQLASEMEKRYDLNRSPGVRVDDVHQEPEHADPSSHEEEPTAHTSHGAEHTDPSGHEEEPTAHASHGAEHADPSSHEEEPTAHANHEAEHADHEEEPAAHASHQAGHSDHGGHGHGHSGHATVKPGTLWNAEVFHWQSYREKRAETHQPQWDEVITEYGHLLDTLSSFHQQLKVLRDGSDLSRVDHPFLHGAVLPLKVDEFRALDGVGVLVSHKVEARLERLAKLLDPYAPGSLAYDLNAHKARGVKLTHDQAGKFYERFWEQWKQFHLEQHWFELEGVSSYYHLARSDSTSSAKAHH